jgi:uncharacterized protein (DUF4415 family)
MNKRSSSKTPKRARKSLTNLAHVRTLRDKDIDLSDVPEVAPEMARNGVWRVNGKPIARGKTRLTMYLDNVLLEYFKAKAGARGYQTLINETLKQAMQGESLEGTLRRVLREEAAAYNVEGRTLASGRALRKAP